MNADSAAAPVFLCMIPLALLVVVAVVVSVVMLTLRVVGPGDHFGVSRPLRRILAFGVPLSFAAAKLGF